MLEYRHFEPKYVKETLYCCYSLKKSDILQLAKMGPFRTLWRAGSNIAINNTTMEITTKSSINVKPFGLRLTASFLFRRRFFINQRFIGSFILAL